MAIDGKWIAIFKGGGQLDKSGRMQDGDALIDKAVASFNASEHEPPVVIGQPKENDPAWGWIAGLKSEVVNGVKTLFCQQRSTAPEFTEWLKNGREKKCSASFYPDGRLRLVAWKGATPPTIKGLSPAFNDNDLVTTFEFVEMANNADGSAAGHLMAVTQDKMAAGNLTFSEAFSEAQIEYPSLAMAYAREVWGAGG